MIAEFTVDSEPVGKQRPRFSRTVYGVRTYTPPKTVDFEMAVRAAYQSQCTGIYFDKSPICVWIDAYYKIPQSTSNTKRIQMTSGEIRPIVKPDLDNIGKALCDALNGVAYHDDAQIVSLTIRKFYSDTPRIDVSMHSE